MPAHPAVDQIAARRWLAPGLLLLDLGVVNAYLVDSSAGPVLVDAGFPGQGAAVLAALGREGIAPGDLHRLVLTHAHPDHAGGAAEVVAAAGVAVEMHPLDAALVGDGETTRPMTPTPGLEHTVRPEMLAPFAIAPLDAEPSLASSRLVPGTTDLRVLPTPGHTAGHVSLLWERHGGVLLAADALANVAGVSLPRVVEDLATARRSALALARLECTLVTFGHGPPTTEPLADAVEALAS